MHPNPWGTSRPASDGCESNANSDTTMTMTSMKAIAATALIGLGALTMSAPAEAGRGYYYHGGNGGNAWGAGLLGFGIGAVVGSALAPSTVYVAPATARLLRPGGLRAAAVEPRLVQLLPQHSWPLFQSQYGLFPGR